MFVFSSRMPLFTIKWTKRVNKEHVYCYQMQGQLHITKKKSCIFAIWTLKGVKITYVGYDEKFCKKMVLKLQKFYYGCVLPELVDPRRRRVLSIRNPDYILKAHREKKSLKVKKQRAMMS